MRSMHKISPVVRATGIIGVVAGLATAVTFAALQSQATLTDNTISSATAELQVANLPCVGEDFGSEAGGFDYANIVPGGADSQTETFCLKNNGTSNLDLNVGMPALPTWTVTPSGTVDNTKVSWILSCTSVSSGAFSLTDSVQNIWSTTSDITGGPLAPGDIATCTSKVSMTADAFTGSSATSSNFDLVFTGTGV